MKEEKEIAILFEEVGGVGGAPVTAAKQAEYFDADFYCLECAEEARESIFKDVKVKTYGKQYDLPLLNISVNRLNYIFNTSVDFLEDYDVVIAHNPRAHILAFKAKQKFDGLKAAWNCHHPDKALYNIHNSGSSGLITRIVHRMTEKKDRSAYHGLDKVFVNSYNTVENQLEKAYNLNSNTEVLYQPVNIFPKSEEVGDFAFAISRVVRFKQFENAIKAISKSDLDIPLKIAGMIEDQEYKTELEKMAENRGVEINFMGYISEEKLKENIRKCKFGVFASENEDFGLVPLEFLSTGKVCFLPSSSGAAEIIPEIYQYSNPEELSKKLDNSESYLDYSLRKKIEKNNERHFNRLEEFINQGV